MRAVVSLREVALSRRQSRPGGGSVGRLRRARHSQRVSARHEACFAPNRRTQRGVQHLERPQIRLECLPKRIDGDVVRYRDDGAGRVWRVRQRTEIFLGVAIDLERREERHVEIARGKSECGALIALDDHCNVAGPQIILSAPQSPRPVVIGRDGQRPATQQAVVIEHEIRGGLGRAIRVQAFIDQAIHAHVSLGRSRHELPQAGGADAGVGRGVER